MSGGTTYTITVAYMAGAAIDVATLDNNDIRVTGPNGFNVLATFQSASPGTGSVIETTTYAFAPPGGVWDPADAGIYSVSLGSGQVADLSGTFVGATSFGSFRAPFSQALVVNSASDVNVANDGLLTLREAIDSATALYPASATITFDPVVFATPQIISVTGGFLNVGTSITMIGAGANHLTLNGNNSGNITVTPAGATNIVVRIAGLTLTNGAEFGAAGGVDINGATLTLDGVAITNSVGTGVRVYPEGNLTLLNSTVSGSKGGGVILGYGTHLIENSTISGNTVRGEGGGVNLQAGALTIRNSTIAFNSALDSGATKGVGGGIVRSSSTQVTVISSIIAKNAPSDVYGNVTATFSMIGGEPMLGPLADNGGPTMTHALLPGSPAIDKGSNSDTLMYDQRGANYYRASGKQADIGAYERQVPPRVLSVVVNDGTAQRSRVTSLRIDFDTPVTLPVNPADAFQLIRQSDNAVVALTATVSNDPATHVTMTFAGALSESGSLADGRYTLTAFAGQISNANGSLDGNADGTSGDDYVLAGNPTNKLFRLYGDSDGNGLIDGLDFGAFRSAFNTNNTIFSFDGNGPVDGLDFAQFRARFGVVI